LLQYTDVKVSHVIATSSLSKALFSGSCWLIVTFPNLKCELGGKHTSSSLGKAEKCRMSLAVIDYHRVNILSTADILCHHCKLGGGSASIRVLGTSVYRRSKWGRRIVRRPKRAKSDCPTTGDR